jgi:hypothetical protein
MKLVLHLEWEVDPAVLWPNGGPELDPNTPGLIISDSERTQLLSAGLKYRKDVTNPSVEDVIDRLHGGPKGLVLLDIGVVDLLTATVVDGKTETPVWREEGEA